MKLITSVVSSQVRTSCTTIKIQRVKNRNSREKLRRYTGFQVSQLQIGVFRGIKYSSCTRIQNATRSAVAKGSLKCSGSSLLVVCASVGHPTADKKIGIRGATAPTSLAPCLPAHIDFVGALHGSVFTHIHTHHQPTSLTMPNPNTYIFHSVWNYTIPECIRIHVSGRQCLLFESVVITQRIMSAGRFN